jgi:L-threonylcarbamoyladenylate synthase
MAHIIKINPNRPQKKRIEDAVRVVKKGGVIVFPTDTVYGLAASIKFPKAVKKIYRLKKRRFNKPFIHLIARQKDMESIVYPSPFVKYFMRQFWPGPLTLILKTIKGKTVGYRIPKHRVALSILKKTGPLAATSANLSGKKSVVSVEEMERTLINNVDLVIDSGPCPLGVESTVLDVTSLPFRILRKGAGENLLTKSS